MSMSKGASQNTHGFAAANRSMGSIVTVAFCGPATGARYAIFRPRVRGTVMGSCCEQKEPLL
jgi:hypothetical protein